MTLISTTRLIAFFSRLFTGAYVALRGDFWLLTFCFVFLTSFSCVAQDLIIHHIDVGQGDCTFIQTESRNILVDAGNNGIGKSAVIPYLKALRISRINYVLASHYHADHIGGLDEVLTAFTVDTVFDRGTDHPAPKSRAYDDYIKAIGSTPRVAVHSGMQYHIGSGIVLRFIAADGQCEGKTSLRCGLLSMTYVDENSLSLAFTITVADTGNRSTVNSEPRRCFTYLSGGDLTGCDVGDAVDLESPVARAVGHADAIKINHHGSRFSTNAFFISTLSPACVFISVGRKNSYGHPSWQTISRLQLQSSIRWIYQTEGANLISPKQRTVGTSVLKLFCRRDQKFFTVDWSGRTDAPDTFLIGTSGR